MEQAGHATNLMILENLQKQFPGLSATTVHRATARMAARGELAVAPPDECGSMRYDARLDEHDHFLCQECDGMKDIKIAEQLRPLIEAQLDNCTISGRLAISGVCNRCKKKERKDV
jgi:Fur family peroxide stress response transcriptional regulator